jgi:hypothetical protein
MNNHQQLIDKLYACAVACNHCAASCLREEDVTGMAACIALDIDCAEICALTAAFLSRGSVHGLHLAKECAEICSACAAECEKHTHMEHCKACAEACRACEAACAAVQLPGAGIR